MSIAVAGVLGWFPPATSEATSSGGVVSRADAAADTTAPQLRLGGRRLQRVVRDHGLFFSARCSEPCRLTVKAVLKISGRTRSVRLRHSGRDLAGDTKIKLELRLSRGTRARSRRAIKRGERVRVVISGIATDESGNVGRARRGIRLKR
jgi:hypothetical protein